MHALCALQCARVMTKVVSNATNRRNKPAVWTEGDAARTGHKARQGRRALRSSTTASWCCGKGGRVCGRADARCQRTLPARRVRVAWEEHVYAFSGIGLLSFARSPPPPHTESTSLSRCSVWTRGVRALRLPGSQPAAGARLPTLCPGAHPGGRSPLRSKRTEYPPQNLRISFSLSFVCLAHCPPPACALSPSPSTSSRASMPAHGLVSKTTPPPVLGPHSTSTASLAYMYVAISLIPPAARCLAAADRACACFGAEPAAAAAAQRKDQTWPPPARAAPPSRADGRGASNLGNITHCARGRLSLHPSGPFRVCIPPFV
jgi:hypothetical protein